MMFQRIISGGQTGVDRAALDWAIVRGIEHGGWCPKGRRAEDGRIAAHYALRETHSVEYLERTRRNVEDSDGTLILNRGPIQGGTLSTWRFLNELDKPSYRLQLETDLDDSVVLDVLAWLERYVIATLNVAGPRESERPGIYAQATRFLDRLLAPSPNA
jgi:hypothetical protein